MDGTEFAAMRKSLGMTQAELGKRLGVPQATISRWETGHHKIEHAAMLRLALERLAAALDVEPQELLKKEQTHEDH